MWVARGTTPQRSHDMTRMRAYSESGKAHVSRGAMIGPEPSCPRDTVVPYARRWKDARVTSHAPLHCRAAL